MASFAMYTTCLSYSTISFMRAGTTSWQQLHLIAQITAYPLADTQLIFDEWMKLLWKPRSIGLQAVSVNKDAPFRRLYKQLRGKIFEKTDKREKEAFLKIYIYMYVYISLKCFASYIIHIYTHTYILAHTHTYTGVGD